MLTSPTQEALLLPRYRRLYSFGDVLDESIQVFRQHWWTFTRVSAICLIPPGLVTAFFGASGALNVPTVVTTPRLGGAIDPASFAPFATAIALAGVVGGLFYVAWTIAIIATTDAYLHATNISLKQIFGRTLRCYLLVLAGGVLLTLAGLALVVVAILPFVIPPIGLVGILIAFVALLVWWLRPRARRTWLKWLIIILSPFGLPTYVWGMWSMFVGAIVLDGKGSISGLGRSWELIDGHWFRAMGVLTVGGLIVGVLQYIPTLLIATPLGVVAATRGQAGLGPTEYVISETIRVLVQVLTSSLGTIVYTLLYVDLRNRREGTDIAERLTQLEAVYAPSNG